MNQPNKEILETPESVEGIESVVDDDLVSFFDLLAQYDFEDKKMELSALKTDPPTSSPGDQFSE